MERTGISIDTYEVVDGRNMLTLTHIFWGDDLEGAIGVAKAHVTSDYFFSSSLLGSMDWKGSTLYLVNKGKLLLQRSVTYPEKIWEIMDQLKEEAVKINSKQKSCFYHLYQTDYQGGNSYQKGGSY